MLKIYDKNHNPIGYIRKYRDLKRESELSTAEKTLSFTYLAHTHDIELEYYIQDKTDEYVVKAIRETTDGWPEYTATLNQEELEGKTWEVFLAKDVTPEEAANLALAGTGWRVDACDVTKHRSMGLTNTNSKIVLQKICTVFMCEMVLDSRNKTVSFHEHLGQDKGVYFMRGLNLRDATISGDTYDYYTRIIPIGKDGLKITEVNDGVEYLENHQYSEKVLTYIWSDNSYEDASALKEDAEKKLDEISKPKKSYSVEVRDLARKSTVYSILEYGLGDTVTLIDRKAGIRDKQRIVKLTEYLQDPDNNTCDIANTRETFDDLQSKIREAASIIEAATNLDGSINGGSVDKVTIDQILNFSESVEYKINSSSAIHGINSEIAVVKADIGTLNTTVLKATDAELKYAKIDLANISAGTIKSAMIEYGAIKTAQIAEGAVTNLKIAGDLDATKITAGTLSVDRLIIRGSNKGIVYELNNITGALQSLNVDTINGEILTPRTITADRIVANSITGNEIAAKTITANNILANSITGDEIAATTIKAINIDLINLFAQDITATGTITGANLIGATGSFENIYVKNTLKLYTDNTSEVASQAVTALSTKTNDLSKLYVGEGFSQIQFPKYCWFENQTMFAQTANFTGGVNISGSSVITGANLAWKIKDGTITATLRRSGASPNMGLSIVVTDASGNNTFHGLVDQSGSRLWATTSELANKLSLSGGALTGTLALKVPTGQTGYYAIGSGAQSTKTNVSYINSHVNSSGSYYLAVAGMWDSTSWTNRTLTLSSSDARLKTNVRDSKISALDTIKQIKIREFDWIESGAHWGIGMVADELETLDPKFSVGGGVDEEGNPRYKSVDQWYMMGYIVKGIQELCGTQLTQETQLNTMQSRIESLQSQLSQAFDRIVQQAREIEELKTKIQGMA